MKRYEAIGWREWCVRLVDTRRPDRVNSSVDDHRKDGEGDGGCVPFIANRSHLLVPFDILAHSPVHDKQYLTTTINYMLPVAAYKSHNQFSSSGVVLRSRCEHSRDPTCQSSVLLVERSSLLKEMFMKTEEGYRGGIR